MKLYSGPPSLACRMLNPQKEIPVLADDGFLLSESIAIWQYLCDQYAPENPIYPKEAKQRALVNHRMCFNMGYYYSSISQYAMAPIFFDYPMFRGEPFKTKVEVVLNTFDTYLKITNTKYAADNHLTIADIALVAATLPLEAIGYKFENFPLATKWYNTFKAENHELWAIAQSGVDEIAEFEKNPPDVCPHPFHPKRKV